MFTLSDLRSKKNSLAARVHVAVIAWLVGVMFSTTAKAQNDISINIQIMPPFTARLYDYVLPNKIIVRVKNTTAEKKDMYFLGTISGGPVLIYTAPDYKPSYPLTLMPGDEVTLTGPDIERVLDPDHMIFEGITKEQIIHDNLPEENYNACFRAFDYITNAPLSANAPMGCSNPIFVTSLEPPTIIAPINEQEIIARSPQFVNMAWTRPPGMPAGVMYKLQLFEVLPSNRNPYDVINSAARPFFERELSENSYLYGPSDPGLVVGKQYVFVVTVVDPAGKVAFRNRGQSPACSFTYRSNDLPNMVMQMKPCDTCDGQQAMMPPADDCKCGLWEKKVMLNYGSSTAAEKACGTETVIILQENATLKLTPNYSCSVSSASCSAAFQYKAMALPANTTMINSSLSEQPLELKLPGAGSYSFTITPSCGSSLCSPCTVKVKAVNGVGAAIPAPLPNKDFIQSKY